MASADGNRLLAADAYVGWRRLVKAARRSVRVYSPYFDRLVVDLLGNADIDASAKSIVTDLSPASGTLDYRGQLLAIRRLLNEGIEVRTLPRLHSKALLVDGATVTVGSQNVTSYARHSKETTVAPVDGAGKIRFLETLETWYADAEPVDLELIERLLGDLDEPFSKAKTEIEALIVAYEEAEAAHREEQRQAAISRLERDIVRSQSTTLASRIRRSADATAYQAGQDVAYARLEWEPGAGEYLTLLRDSYDIDFTRWTFSIAGIEFDDVQLEPLVFYPALLSPGGRMAFVRVAKQRITYVWRGLRRGAPIRVGGYKLYVSATFPDDQDDDANLVLTFGWDAEQAQGYQMRLLFDGSDVLAVAEGEPVGRPAGTGRLAEIVESTYEDEDAWNQVLRDFISPAHNPVGFLREKNADTFFPFGRLRIDLARFLDQPVLLIQPDR